MHQVNERPLTDAQLEVMSAFYLDGWHRPMDLGGRDGTHHSATLRALTRRGLVERKQRGAGGRRGAFVYRITAHGRAVLAAQPRRW